MEGGRGKRWYIEEEKEMEKKKEAEMEVEEQRKCVICI